MIKKWSNYNIINENLQKALSILKKNGVPERNTDFLKLKEILRRNTGYLGKFTEWLVVQKKSISSLEELYKKIKEFRLSKPIDEYKTPEEVIDSIIRENADVAVNQMIMAIPSKARYVLKTRYCSECDDGKIDCDECDDGEVTCECQDECSACYGDGEVSCYECDGDGTITCTTCDGDGTDNKDKTCKKCNGDGNIPCKKCEYGTVPCKECTNKGVCKKCDGKEQVNCVHCKGKGYIDCQRCKDGTQEWKSFLNFLKLHADKKELIIDFFSKKGGRYSDDDYDDDGINMAKSDVEKLINLPSIDKIKEDIETEPNIEFIFENKEILIIASNYDGLQKYGSSYWCITEDEDTFSDYVFDESYRQQWIVYFKGKAPLVDDHSVMGVTINILSGEISAAHWEDDTEVRDNIISDIFSSIKVENIIKADKIFGREGSILRLLEPEKHRDHFKEIILEIIESEGDKTIPLHQIIDALTDDDDEVMDYLERNNIGKSLFKVIKSILKEEKIKLKDDWIQDEMFFYDLKDYTIYNKNWNNQSIDLIMRNENFDKKLRVKYITWFISNGYNISRYLNSSSVPLILSEIDMGKVIFSGLDSIGNWSSINNILTKEYKKELYNKILKKKKEFIVSNSRTVDSFIKSAIKWIKKENLISDYKKDIIDCINMVTDDKSTFGREILDYIIDNFDDDDIEIACTHKLLHPRISSKYNFEMKRRVLENMKYWDEFLR